MICHLCDCDSSEVFLDLGAQPLANKYPKESQFGEESFFPMRVLFCSHCKNVQLGTVISRSVMFEDYYYLSSVNQGLVRHFDSLAESLRDAKFVLDVGSNDGILLKPLKALGVNALGIDPSVNVSKIANDAGLETVVGFFTPETAKVIQEKYGMPDVIVASSVFTHMENPSEFLSGVGDILSPGGKCIIEVEYIGNILRDVQFERFYLDRIFYYSLSSIKNLLEKFNMYVADVEVITPHGGSLRVTAMRKGEGAEPHARVNAMLDEEDRMLTQEKLLNFKEVVDAQVRALRETLLSLKAEGLAVAGYGAPARVSTITNYADIGSDLISFIVDDSPLKQNRFSPGKHIPILESTVLSERKPDVLVVFAHEYLDDIRAKTNNSYRYFIPIPPREV